MDLSGSWFGHVAGTNRGPINVRLRQRDTIILGRLVLHDVVHGPTSAWLEGEIDGRRLTARLEMISGTAPVVPSNAEVTAEVNETGSRLTGQWKTDIDTHGTLVLTKDAPGQESVDREAAMRRRATPQAAPTHEVVAPAPAPGPPPAPAPPAPPAVLPPIRLDFRNVPIPAFRMRADDLMDLIRVFTEAVTKARLLEIDRIQTQDNEAQRRALAGLPHPSAEISAASGQLILSADLRSLNAALLPDDIKTVQLTSYSAQGGYTPSHGVVVRINNINGNDPANLEGNVAVQGTDPTWVAGTFANIRDFFGARRAHRRWIHRTTTGQLILFGVVFPLALWTLYRALPFLPARFTDTPLFTFGLFVYTFLAYYLGFDRLLRYARWAFPLYEFDLPRRHQRFQRHRLLFGALILGIVTGFLSDLFLGFLRSR